MRVHLENTGTLPAQLALEVRAGPQSDTDLYDGTGGDFQVRQASLNLLSGESGPLEVNVNLQPGDPLYDLIKTGAFRWGPGSR